MSDEKREQQIETLAARLFGGTTRWGNYVSLNERRAWRRTAAALLDGAVQSMLADAWEQGAVAQAAAYGMDKDTGPNPYRTAEAAR